MIYQPEFPPRTLSPLWFLRNLFHTDATLDEGTVPDIKVMENDINMMNSEVNANSLLDFFNQITSKSSSSIATGMPIKEEPLTEDDLKALQKDRQKKDNHNLSKSHLKFGLPPPPYGLVQTFAKAK